MFESYTLKTSLYRTTGLITTLTTFLWTTIVLVLDSEASEEHVNPAWSGQISQLEVTACV